MAAELKHGRCASCKSSDGTMRTDGRRRCDGCQDRKDRASEALRECVLDMMVKRRLATDFEYRNPENAEHQAEREAQIVDECKAALDRLG